MGQNECSTSRFLWELTRQPATMTLSIEIDLRSFQSMSIATPLSPNKLTAADLSAMPDEKDYELIDGQVEIRKVGYESSRIAARLIIF